MPPLLRQIRQNENTDIDYQCLQVVIRSVGQGMSKFAKEIFSTINAVIFEPRHQIQVMELLVSLNQIGANELNQEMNLIVPSMLQLIDDAGKTRTVDQQIGAQVISTLKEFRPDILNHHLFLLVPTVLKFLCGIQSSLDMLGALMKCQHFKYHLGNIVHSLLNLLDARPQTSQNIVHFLSQVADSMGIDFAPYILLVEKVIKRGKHNSKEWDTVVQRLLKKKEIDVQQQHQQSASQSIAGSFAARVSMAPNKPNQAAAAKGSETESLKSREKVVNIDALMREFDTQKCSIEADWREWFGQICYQLLQQSPSVVLYACCTLAEVYSPIATDLCNYAFVCVWKIMTDKHKEMVMKNFLIAINAPNTPPQILQALLNLAEFMEHDENTDLKLFAPATLAKLAQRCNAYAKALYYWEIEFENDPKNTLLTYNDLQQPEAVEGVLEYAKKHSLVITEKDWYLKLHRYHDALELYSERDEEQATDMNVQFGKMECYRALSKWDELGDLVEKLWTREMAAGENPLELSLKGSMSKSAYHRMSEVEFAFQGVNEQQAQRCKIAEYGAASTWNLQKWDKFKEYVQGLDGDVVHKQQRCFYQAVIKIQENRFSEAQKMIDRARDMIDNKIVSLIGESYNRAYKEILDSAEFEGAGGDHRVQAVPEQDAPGAPVQPVVHAAGLHHARPGDLAALQPLPAPPRDPLREGSQVLDPVREDLHQRGQLDAARTQKCAPACARERHCAG